jgi:hypothetical protein
MPRPTPRGTGEPSFRFSAFKARCFCQIDLEFWFMGCASTPSRCWVMRLFDMQHSNLFPGHYLLLAVKGRPADV